jgi:hypothetical protein
MKTRRSIGGAAAGSAELPDQRPVAVEQKDEARLFADVRIEASFSLDAEQGPRAKKSPLTTVTHARGSRRDELRISTVPCQKSVASPRCSAQQDEYDRCQSGPEERPEMRPAHQRPNVPAMISIAAGNETMTTQAHARSLSPDVAALLPEPAIKYASAAPTVMSRKKTAASAALEPVTAAPSRLFSLANQSLPGSIRAAVQLATEDRPRHGEPPSSGFDRASRRRRPLQLGERDRSRRERVVQRPPDRLFTVSQSALGEGAPRRERDWLSHRREDLLPPGEAGRRGSAGCHLAAASTSDVREYAGRARA